jgi:hypothetical protein
MRERRTLPRHGHGAEAFGVHLFFLRQIIRRVDYDEMVVEFVVEFAHGNRIRNRGHFRFLLNPSRPIPRREPVRGRNLRGARRALS